MTIILKYYTFRIITPIQKLIQYTQRMGTALDYSGVLKKLKELEIEEKEMIIKIYNEANNTEQYEGNLGENYYKENYEK